MNVVEQSDGVTFDVRVTPRSSRDAVLGESDGAIRIALTAPPVDGEANEALVSYLAERLGVRRNAIEVVRGKAGRRKSIRIRGVGRAAIEALLAAT